MKEDDDDSVAQIKMAKDWLEGLAQGRGGREIETRALQNLKSVQVQRGLILCNFVVPKSLSDRDGNWRVGAIATLIDVVGAAAIVSSVGSIKVSVDFNISYFSTAKIDEEVEIEAKVMGHKGKLSSNMVEIRRKGNGEMIALGKQWMASINLDLITHTRNFKVYVDFNISYFATGKNNIWLYLFTEKYMCSYLNHHQDLIVSAKFSIEVVDHEGMCVFLSELIIGKKKRSRLRCNWDTRGIFHQ